MSMIGAKTFSICGEPGADNLVLCGRENDISISGVSINGSVSSSCGVQCGEVAYLIWVKARS